MQYKAQIITQWLQMNGNYPELRELLQSGDSIMDVTGQPATNIPTDPNSAVWELWCDDYQTIADIAADNRFLILSEWAEEDGVESPETDSLAKSKNGLPDAAEFGQTVAYLARQGTLTPAIIREMLGNEPGNRTRSETAKDVKNILKIAKKAKKAQSKKSK